jgi:DNA-binding NtrC family response regulator
MRILLVDDEAPILQSLTTFLGDLGHDVVSARNGTEALQRFRSAVFHVILTDVKMPGMDGIELLSMIKQHGRSPVDVIVFTGHGDEELAVRALRAGAFDYLRKPLSIEELAIALERAEEHLNLRVENEALTTRFREEVETQMAPLRERVRQMPHAMRAELGLHTIHMFSEATRRVFEHAHLFRSKRDVPVLIEGESGTGKELVARYLHYGHESPGPFVALNCTAMPAELFQTELFGYEGGAFTGAKPAGSAGKIELAQGGTLFLDEIGEIPLDFQVRLLRVLETREYYRVGGLKKLHTDTRFIFATNRTLATEVAQGRFRRDLYYRIDVGHIVVPPLRERREEIVPLAEAFLTEFNQRHGKIFQGFSADAQQYLCSQPWEGNVRELRNTIERAVIISDGLKITMASLGRVPYTTGMVLHANEWQLPDEPFDLAQHELDIVRQALAKHAGNRTQTAKYLGLTLKALQSRLRKIAQYSATEKGVHH